MRQVFDTRMGRSVKIITAITHFLILPVPVVLMCSAGWLPALLNVLFLSAIFMVAFLLRPYQYSIDDGQLIIRKHILQRAIPLKDIVSAEPTDFKALGITLRLWGSGGLWGWYGHFSTRKLGNITLQCTEKEHLVLVCTRKEKIVFSPRDPAAFITALQQHIKQNADS